MNMAPAKTILVLGSFADSLILFRGHLIATLVKRGHRVVACAPQANQRVVSALQAMGAEYRAIPLSRTGANALADLLTLLFLCRLFVQLRADVLLAYTIKPVVYGSIAARVARVPRSFALITGLGFAFTNGRGGLRRLAGLIARSLYRVALHRVVEVFFQNPDDLHFFRSSRIISSEQQATVIPGSGVDTEAFQYIEAYSTTDFLMIARLVKDKGVLEYVEAARRVRARYPQCRFRLVGWIDENPSSIRQEELDAWIREGVIEYLGRLDDVRAPLTECAVYVLPSYREGTPRTVLEAMAIGRAVVTTDAPGCRETVVHGENGFLVPVANGAMLAGALMRFLENPALIRAFGRASRKIAEQKYDVRLVNQMLIERMKL